LKRPENTAYCIVADERKMKMWKIKYLLTIKSTASSLWEGRKGEEAL
jgi:hypothetical protein